jgi:DNA-binding IclR family transcriptional regulator
MIREQEDVIVRMVKAQRPSSGVQVLHKTLDVLETLRESHSGLALADLARALGLPKPTAHRIVATLETRGYLSRDLSGRYRMSRKFFELDTVESDEQILTRAAMPIMQKLLDSCKETLNLGVLDAGEVVVISTIESPQGIRMASKVGNRRHMHSTALGKILLSALPEKDIQRLVRLKRLPRLTPHTIVTEQALAAELTQVRKQGFALDNEENEPGGRCIAAPICGGGRVLAALSISAPIFRMDLMRAHSLVPELVEACRSITTSFDSRLRPR